MPRRLLLGPLLAAVLITAGCSGGSPDPAPPPAAAAEPSGAAPAARPSATPTQSAAACLTGTYRLVRFVGVGASKEAYGTGQGGDVTAVFRGQGFTLAGAGRKPVVVTLAGQTADLTVDGTAKGRFTVDGASTTFTTTTTKGSATLQAGRQKQKLSMREVAAVVGLNGSAKVACTAQAMTVTLSTVRLEFGRV
jgi:hypothetical protein